MMLVISEKGVLLSVLCVERGHHNDPLMPGHQTPPTFSCTSDAIWKNEEPA